MIRPLTDLSVGEGGDRGRERYGRGERKERDAEVQRWRYAEVKRKTLLVGIWYALEYLKNKNAR